MDVMESGKAVEGVWSRLLTAASVKEKAETCNLFVIGDNSDALSRRIVGATGSKNSGKESASAVDKAQSILPLKYYHVKLVHPDDAVTVEDRDEAPDCNVWSLDDFEMAGLCSVVTSSLKSFDHCVAILSVDLSAPWTVKEQLDRNFTILRATIGDAISADPKEAKIRANVKEYTRRYAAASANAHGSTGFADENGEGSIGEDDELDQTLLPAGVLDENIGVPIVVCCSGAHSDSFNSLASEEREFILAYLRENCMTYGAALFSFSAETAGDQTKTILRYLMHRFHPSANKFSPQLALHLDLEKIVLPAGWDNPSNLSATSITDSSERKFHEIIKAPPSTGDDNTVDSKASSSKVTAYSTDGFLERIYKLQSASTISSQLRSAVSELGSAKGSDADAVEPPASQGASSVREAKKASRTSTRTSRARASKTGEADAAVTDAKDNPEVIKDFFQSLLGPKRGNAGAAKKGVRRSVRRSARNQAKQKS